MELDNKKIKEIEEQFAKLGISQENYPQYTDPVSFGYQFKKCSVLREVPIYTSDSCCEIQE